MAARFKGSVVARGCRRSGTGAGALSATRSARASEGAVRNRSPVKSIAYRVILAAVVSCLALHAPADLEAQTARTMVRGEASHGGFGAIVFKGSGVNDQFAGFFGARGAWMMDHVFALGLGAYMMGGGVDVQRTVGQAVGQLARQPSQWVKRMVERSDGQSGGQLGRRSDGRSEGRSVG